MIMCVNKQIEKKNMKAIAFLDLLGFSNAVMNDTEEALSMLQSYNSILHQLNLQSQLHPSNDYIEDLQELARRNSIESFDDFLPFSDSIFITSNNCSDFLMQLGSFLIKSFHFTAHIYGSPKNRQDPTAYSNIEVRDDGNGRLTTVNIPCHVPPTLFRGGIAYGDVNIITPIGILNKERINSHTLIGNAVVKAVHLEKRVKGPRIVFDKDIYERLDEKAKLYCCNLIEDPNYYELLWPGMSFILENSSTFQNEFSHFFDLFDPAYNLWSYYKDNNVAKHYERFLELIVVSTIKIYSHMGMKNFVMQKIEKAIDGKFSCTEKTKIFGSLECCI